jgi:hypothetical protein
MTTTFVTSNSAFLGRRHYEFRAIAARIVDGAAHGVHVQQVVRCRRQQLVEPGPT